VVIIVSFSAGENYATAAATTTTVTATDTIISSYWEPNDGTSGNSVRTDGVIRKRFDVPLVSVERNVSLLA